MKDELKEFLKIVLIFVWLLLSTTLAAYIGKFIPEPVTFWDMLGIITYVMFAISTILAVIALLFRKLF